MYGLALLWVYAMVAEQGCTQAVSPDTTSFGRAHWRGVGPAVPLAMTHGDDAGLAFMTLRR